MGHLCWLHFPYSCSAFRDLNTSFLGSLYFFCTKCGNIDIPKKYEDLGFVVLRFWNMQVKIFGLRGCCFGIANMILVMRMREKLYSALLLQDISFFDTETVGDLTSRLGADCQQVSRVIGNDLNLISRNALQGTGALIYLFTLSWPLALSTVLICSALSTVMFFYGQYQKRAAKLTQEFTACANEVAQEAFSLMRTVRVYGTEKQECGRYMQWLKKLADISLRQSMAYGFWTLSFNTLYHATQVIAVLVGGIFIMGGHITVEKLTKFILYSEWLIYSTWFVGDNWSSLMQSIGASEKVFQLMDLLPSKQFLLQGLKLQTVIGHIEFVNVSFHYPSRITVPVLQHLNISLHPKEVVAIVGSNGSGKSTLVHLLLRLYEPTSGQIFIDGSPLEELDIKWLRENIGFVGQEPRLFRMDVSSNIRYGCTREISQEDVEWAAKQAYAHDFILSLPNGYETLVDNDLLSGGQKQRIAIARAILRDPAILIFDEATSALDADSEHYVKQVLHSVRHGSKEKRTVIVIAHRLSTIQAADRIVVMDSGRIVQMGDHKELLSKDGLYAQLTKRQTDGLLS
ncbi:ABC transporter B family member 26, chloroplastic isoform X4 [Magnolia sinica]|uniref:ABC transporter B family member 26, chloroplastic isoform X4 n=1 Tax=Magnolia sinica TaxID=86752 RepID=UPI0026597E5A|nr:ABC transporter B family member 26, chloroplastic isoform X4 [Magnolia sinica]